VPSRLAAARRGALLLEVVIALAVLVAAMGLLGAQLAGGLEMVKYADTELRGSLLADRILALVQADPNMQKRMAEYEELEDKFGDDYPGYFYYIKTEPVDRETQDLKVVTIRVLHQPNAEHPDSIDGAVVVRQLGLLRADPPKVDLIEQAGLSEDLAEQLRQLVPIAGFDPHAVDLHQLVAMLDEGTLQQLLPMLMPLLQQLQNGGLPPEWASLAGSVLGGGIPGGVVPGGSPPSGGLPPGTSAQDLADAIRQMAGNAGQQPPPGAGLPPRPPMPGVNPGLGGPQPPPPPAGGGATPPPPPRRNGGPPPPGRGSGANGEYTIEDLMRMRDAWEQQKGGGK
jgi:hypothetical protein